MRCLTSSKTRNAWTRFAGVSGVTDLQEDVAEAEGASDHQMSATRVMAIAAGM